MRKKLVKAAAFSMALMLTVTGNVVIADDSTNYNTQNNIPTVQSGGFGENVSGGAGMPGEFGGNVSGGAGMPGGFGGNVSGGAGMPGGFGGNVSGGAGMPGGFDGNVSGGAGMPGGPMDSMGNNGNYTHGSGEAVTEDMLVTQGAIASDYKVNSDIQGDAEDGEYEKYFNHDEIENVYIDIDENNWNYMLQNASDKPTVLTNSVTIGGETINYTGIKTKGNLTLSSVWNSNSDRFSFTVNFGKYIKKKTYGKTQNFHGLSKVALNNIYGDASLMKEYLSYELMTKMGVPTPCYSLVNLYVNDELWGVYMMVESVDSSLTERTLGEKSDLLVKPESSGGDLVYDSAMDAYINDEGEFDFTDVDYPTDASEALYKYNGIWENDEDTFDDIKDMLPTLFKWMKTLNELSNAENANTEEYKTQLESIMDVDEILRYFATNTYLVNLDSYQSEKMQNYTFYMNEEGMVHILPWDYNYSFGGYGVGNASDMVNFSIDNPVIDVTLDERPLLNVLLQNDDYRALYEKYLNDCCIIAKEGGTTSAGETYEADNFANILSKYAETLNETYENDPTAFYSVTQYKAATEALKTLIADRTKAVLNQLAGNDEKVETTVNLQTIGDCVGGMGGNFDGNMPDGNRPDMPDGNRPDMPDGNRPDMPGGNQPNMPDGNTPNVPDEENPDSDDIMYGDVNGDNKVNLTDAKLSLKVALGIMKIDELNNQAAADYNKDSVVNLLDTKGILKQALGISQ